MNTFNALKATVRAIVADEWVAIRSEPVFTQGASYDPPSGAAWIYYEVLSALAFNSSFGGAGKTYDENRGVVMVHAYVPIGPTADVDADALRDAFEALFKTRVLDGGQTSFGTPQPGGGGDGDDDGALYRQTSSIAFVTTRSA